MKKLLFSNSQIGVSTYFGGPISAIYMLVKNFKSIDNKEMARKTLLIGSLLSAALLFSLPFIPEELPNSVIPLTYVAFAVGMAQKHPFKKHEILESEEYTFRSNWKVALIAIISMIIFMGLILAMFFYYESIGLVTLE